jgi:TctA family transporter
VVLSFSVVISLSGASLVKGLSAAALGALVALVGLDPMSGVRRFAFGTSTLLGGIDFIAVIIGLFAITEVLVGVEEHRRVHGRPRQAHAAVERAPELHRDHAAGDGPAPRHEDGHPQVG